MFFVSRTQQAEGTTDKEADNEHTGQNRILPAAANWRTPTTTDVAGVVPMSTGDAATVPAAANEPSLRERLVSRR